jgi:hypothetical protein
MFSSSSFAGLRSSSWGRRVFYWEQNDTVLYGFFFFFSNLIFSFKEGILVILHLKMTSFWVFHPFSRFHLTKGAILYGVGSLRDYFIPIETLGDQYLQMTNGLEDHFILFPKK